jgi:zinc transport system substrate-binding protein
MLRTILTLASVPSLLTAAACSSVGDREASVVASFYPLAFAAERLAGDCVDVLDLTPAGVEPHDLELDPSDVEAIATADLVLYLGGGFQPGVEDAIPDAGGRTLDVLDAVETVAPPPGEAEGGSAVDPHVWLDPTRFATIADRVADELDATGVAAECDLAASADALRGDLEALDDDLRAELESCRDDLLVTSHAAFGYLADAYGLRQEAIAGIEPETEPDPQRLAALTELVEREGVTTIFTEELVAPDVARTLADEAGVRTDVLSTIEGLTDEQLDRGEDYLTLMRGNLDALRAALRCA